MGMAQPGLQGFNDLFGSKRGATAIRTRADVQNLGQQHEDLRELIEELEAAADRLLSTSVSDADSAYNAYAAYCAGLTGIPAPDAFHDVEGQLRLTTKEYLATHGDVHNAFTGAAMGTLLKDHLPPKISLALHRAWWLLFDDPRAQDCPTEAELRDIAISFH